MSRNFDAERSAATKNVEKSTAEEERRRPSLTCPSNFDEFLTHTIGEFGSYQKLIVLLLCIPACFIGAFVMFNLVFMIYKPDFKCNLDDQKNSTVNLATVITNQCTVDAFNGSHNTTLQCSKFTFSEEFMTETVVSKWNLVCGREFLGRTYFGAIYLAALPSMIYPFVQDKFGRKKAFLLDLSVYVTFGTLSVLLSQSLEMFIVLKFIGTITGVWDVCLCWALEFVAGSKRTTVTTWMSVGYGIGNLSLVLIAWLCKDWRSIGIWTAVPFVFLFSYLWLIPESPRWLLAQNRIEELLDVVTTIGKRQGVILDRDKTLKMLIELRRNIYHQSCTVQKPRLRDFFRSKNLIAKCAVMTFVIVVANQVYNAILFNAENVSKNMFVGYGIPVLFELPSTLINLYFVNTHGRVASLAGLLALAGLCCFLAWPLGGLTAWSTVLLAGAARFFVSAALGVEEQFAEELYPTVGRGAAAGVSYGAFALTGFGMQYLVHAATVFNALPMVIMATLSVLAALLTMLLPDTLGLPMPDTVAKAEAQGSVGLASLRRNVQRLCGCWAAGLPRAERNSPFRDFNRNENS